ncbi:RNA polymerase sigma factor [bacterium SCSIO 12741]|nr:RNA polymerase sigma factor [bacterium SCSIO 12741]
MVSKTEMDISGHLIQQCIEGDKRAHEELFKKSFRYLMSLCIRYYPNEEDARFMLNDIFYKILLNLEKKKEEVPYKAWIRKIAVNTIINEYKKQQTKKNTANREAVEMKPNLVSGSVNDVMQQFDAEEILHLVRKLPPMSNKVFNLYVIEGYKHEEIAEMLDISEGTSRWHLNNARNKLKEMLSKIL